MKCLFPLGLPPSTKDTQQLMQLMREDSEMHLVDIFNHYYILLPDPFGTFTVTNAMFYSVNMQNTSFLVRYNVISLPPSLGSAAALFSCTATSFIDRKI